MVKRKPPRAITPNKTLYIENEPGGYRCFCKVCGFEDHIELGKGLPIPVFVAWSKEIKGHHAAVHRKWLEATKP